MGPPQTQSEKKRKKALGLFDCQFVLQVGWQANKLKGLVSRSDSFCLCHIISLIIIYNLQTWSLVFAFAFDFASCKQIRNCKQNVCKTMTNNLTSLDQK